MFSALIGDRKGIWPRKLCIRYPSWNVLSSTHFPSLPSFLLLRRTWWNGVSEDVWRGRVKGKPANPGLPGRMAVKPACVCLIDMIRCVCQAVEREVKSMTDNVTSIRQMSEVLTDAAGSGEFREKMNAELAGLTSAFDDVAKRSQTHNERLLSAQQRVETLISSIKQVDSEIDEITMRLSQLDVNAADPNSVFKLQTEFKVTFRTRVFYLSAANEQLSE